MARYREFNRVRIDLDRKDDPKTWQEREVRDIVEGANVPGYGQLELVQHLEDKTFWRNVLGDEFYVRTDLSVNSFQ